MTSKTYVYKVIHVSPGLQRTEQVVRGAAGAWQAIDWVEQLRGESVRCTAINLTRLAALNAEAAAAAMASATKGGA